MITFLSVVAISSRKFLDILGSNAPAAFHPTPLAAGDIITPRSAIFQGRVDSQLAKLNYIYQPLPVRNLNLVASRAEGHHYPSRILTCVAPYDYDHNGERPGRFAGI